MSAAPTVVGLIERKKRGEALSADELGWMLRGYVAGEIPDYQVAAWLMAVCWRGMTAEETLAFTHALVDTGERLDWPGVDRPTVDKHSTGGVGDKTSIVLVPLLAAAGAAFVKVSGRGLGHTGGTLDKLESIPGFRCELGRVEMQAQVRRIGCALVGQSPQMVPGDRLLYALRDVTGTVDAMPLIAGSIMSKKLAAGAGSIVLDVKWGSGALMPTPESAEELAGTLIAIGNGAGHATRAALTPMREPLGDAVGNALEVREAIATLRGDGPAALWELTLALGAELLVMSGLDPDRGGARSRLIALRDGGAGAEVLARLIEAQGGDPRVVDDPARLPSAPVVRTVTAPGGGWVSAADAREIAEAALALGAGRRAKSDVVDPAVGVVMATRIGARVEAGDPIASVHARDEAGADAARDRLLQAIRIDPEPVETPPFEPRMLA